MARSEASQVLTRGKIIVLFSLGGFSGVEGVTMTRHTWFLDEGRNVGGRGVGAI